MGEPALQPDPFDVVEDVEEDILDDDDTSELPEGSDGEETADEDEDGKEQPDESEPDETAALRREVEALKRQQYEEIQRRQTEAEQQKVREEFEEAKTKRLNDLDAKISDLRERRRTARDDADEILAEEIDDQIAEVRLERAAARQLQHQEQSGPAARHPEDDIAPAARAWLELNPEFHTDREFNKRVLDLNAKLREEGFSTEDPKLYREIDKRLAAHQDSGKKPQAKPPGVAGVSRGNPIGHTRPASRRQFSSADKAKMVKYGFGDPNRAEDRKAWLKYSSGTGVS